MKIVVASDHGGYALKLKVAAHLKERGIEVEDLGTHSEESVDYPVYAKKVAKSILSGECEKGILICGTGIGMSMAANKHKGIRAALCTDLVMAEYTRRHNNANVLCMGARIIAYEMAEMIADKFLETEFEGGRHQRRIDLFDK